MPCSFDNKNDKQKETFRNGSFNDGLTKDIFKRAQMGDTHGLSVEDKRFIATMNRDMVKNDDGYWVAPLPFREEVYSLPNSHEEALKRKLATRRPCWYLPHFWVQFCI